MAISKLFAGADSTGDPGTTLDIAGLDSTGYTHIVIAVAHEGSPATITPSDNKSSTIEITGTKENHTNGDMSAQLFVLKIGSPGSSHDIDITFGASVTWKWAIAWFVDSDDGDVEQDAIANAEGTGTAQDAGTLSTSGASVVSFMAVKPYGSTTYTISSGWTEDIDSIVGVSGYGASRGAETTTPIDPLVTGSTSNDWAAVAISLREPGGAPASVSILPAILQNYRNMGYKM